MDRLKEAIKLRESGHPEEARIILEKLAQEYPENAQVNYQCAWCFDVLGLEKDAIPYYEKAIELGLPDNDLKDAYLGLGSTYRTVGEYNKSENLLLDGIKKFDDNGLRSFLAMTKYNLGKHEEAMEILLKLLSSSSEDESIQRYKKAIFYYSDKLNKIW